MLTLGVSFLSAASADSEKENKKKKAKKAFEVNFDEDVDFEAYFRKTKVRTEFLPPLCSAISVHLRTAISRWLTFVLLWKLALYIQHRVCSVVWGLLAPNLTVLPTLK